MTLASRLLLLVALALTPPLVSGVVNDVLQRRDRQAELQRAALAESRSMQDSLGLVTTGIQHVLVTLADSPVVRDGRVDSCSAYLKAVAGRMPEFTLLSVYGRDGRVRCSSAGAAPGSFSVADRAYYRRAMETNAFSGGDLITGMVTGRQVVNFALPIQGENGETVGLMAASVEQDWLAEQLTTGSVPRGALVIMVDPGGTVVAAAQNGVPLRSAWVGQPTPRALLGAMHRDEPAVVEMEGPDGRERLFGAVPPSPALAGNTTIVGLDRERAFTDLRQASLRNILGLVVGGVVALVVGVFGARRFVLAPLARLAQVADRVGAGDLGARADLGQRAGEVRELGAVFDRMTAALATRQGERDRAEAALRRNEARLRFALEASGQGAFDWDLATDVVRRSDVVAAMFGFGPGEGLVWQDYFDRIVPEDRAAAREATDAGLATGRVVLSYRIMPREGERRFITSYGEVMRDEDGAANLVGLLVDETERHESVSALRESEARFQAIADCIDQMVWSTRPDGYHDYFNQRWYDYTGTAPGGSDGAQWLALFHPDDHESTVRKWQESLRTGCPYHQEYRLRHVSGRFRWVLGRAQPIRDENDRISRWYGTCTDIDDIVQAREVLARSREALTREIADRTAELMATEEQLRHSQKMEAVGQLTGGIAHDFNNMLQAIGGALELLVRRVDQDKLDDAKRFAGIARATVDRAASLTHRLLAFARRQTLSPEAVDMAGLLDGMSELVARTVGAAIEVSVCHHDEPWPVLCDLSQLENVVFNLCINARDAMPDGGKLSISTRNVSLEGRDVAGLEDAQAGDYVEIAVADTGNGMDDATKARAFEPFFTTKPLGQGTGLGLSQVYGFVRQSGGFVRLESEPGHGTTVRLVLPRHAALEAPPAERDNSPVVLVVKDDAVLRTSTAEHLRAGGLRVRESADGAEAAAQLERLTRLDMLVTDVALAGPLNGRQVAETARRRWPGLPVLFITYYAGLLGEGDLEPGMSVVAKPISPEVLAARVRATLLADAPTA